MSEWKRLKPLEHPASSGCGNCPPKPVRLNLNRNHHPGFGACSLARDGVMVESDVHGGGISYGRRAERVAAAAPDHDWRFKIDAPLGDYTYQRHGLRVWLLVERGLGFA